MTIETNMPLRGLIKKLLKGEAEEIYDEELRTYVENKIGNNQEALQQALTEIKDAIDKWKDSYFISVYEERVDAYRRGNSEWTPQDLDDLFMEEEYLIKEGKTGLTSEYLYNEMERIGFINEHHRDAMDAARMYNDMDFLIAQWEESVLMNIRLLESIVKQMLNTALTESKTEKQKDSRPEKQPIDPPEIFGIDMCCEITGYAKNTIYKLTCKNEIPCFRAGKNGRLLKFKRGEIMEWMLARRQETKEEFIKRMGGKLASNLH